MEIGSILARRGTYPAESDLAEKPAIFDGRTRSDVQCQRRTGTVDVEGQAFARARAHNTNDVAEGVNGFAVDLAHDIVRLKPGFRCRRTGDDFTDGIIVLRCEECRTVL